MKNLLLRLRGAFRGSIRNQFAALVTPPALVSVMVLGVVLVSFAVNQTRAVLQSSALAQLESVRAVKHEQFTPYLSSIVKTFGFYDVFVITRDGQVAYTYAKESSPSWSNMADK